MAITGKYMQRENFTEQTRPRRLAAITRLYREISRRASGSCFKSGRKEGWRKGGREEGRDRAAEGSGDGCWRLKFRDSAQIGSRLRDFADGRVWKLHNATGGFPARRSLVGHLSLIGARQARTFLPPLRFFSLAFLSFLFFFSLPHSCRCVILGTSTVECVACAACILLCARCVRGLYPRFSPARREGCSLLSSLLGNGHEAGQ